MQPKIDYVRALLLVDDTCLVIPPYQRPYEWNRDRWQSLIRDIVEGLTTQRASHFIGVAITSESKPDCRSAKSPLLHRHVDIIDGQQRLLTLRIWLQAILDHSKDFGQPLDVKFTNVYCQETDLEDWESVIDGSWITKYSNYRPEASGLLHAYTYFRWILWLGQESMTEQEPDEIPKITKRQAVFSNFTELSHFWDESLERRSRNLGDQDTSLRLSRSEQLECGKLLRATVDQLSLLVLDVNSQDEDPADIFNALNGQRTEMFQFDHLRNFVFANINDADSRSHLYNEYWKNVEREVVRQKISVKGSSALDTYLYDLLISLGEKKHQAVSKDKTSRQFARYYNSARNQLGAIGVAEKLILPNLVSWTSVKKSGHPFVIGTKTFTLPEQTKTSLLTMEWMSSGPVVPLLLNVVNRYFYAQLPELDLNRGMKAVEGYLARYIISGQPLNPLRASIMTICARLGSTFSLEQLEELLREDKPNDSELKRKLLPSTSNRSDPYVDFGRIYETRTSKQLLAIFQGIERKRAGEHCSNFLRENQEDALTIDHIYPQSPDRWRADLKKWELAQSPLEKRLHTLGNLAVVPKSINSEMSNERFNQKKQILKENAFVKLEVNSEWQTDSISEWRPDLIDQRAESLLADFIEYYPY
jgi:Protein of unknown function DUF262/Protein of unknown function (DUF1524)